MNRTGPPRVIVTHEDDLHVPSYGLGYADGLEAGRRQLEAEWTDLHAAAAAVARRAAAREPFDVLAERRGDRARAERQRELLRARGVVA